MLRLKTLTSRDGQWRAVNLTLTRGRLYTLAPSAAASAFLALLSGLQPVSSGQIFLGEKDLTALSIEQRARAGLSLVDNRAPQLLGLTVHDYLELAARNILSARERREVFVSVDLPSETEALFLDEQMPVVTRSRVELAAALVRPGKVFLVDVLPALDEACLEKVARQLCKQGATVLTLTAAAWMHSARLKRENYQIIQL